MSLFPLIILLATIFVTIDKANGNCIEETNCTNLPRFERSINAYGEPLDLEDIKAVAADGSAPLIVAQAPPPPLGPTFRRRCEREGTPCPPPRTSRRGNHGTDFITMKAYIDATMTPKDLVDVITDCNNEPSCAKALEAAAKYVGIPPELITVVSLAGEFRREGEESFFSFTFPPGYEFCGLKVRTVSVVPAGPDDDRASHMDVGANRNAVGVYTWTPQDNYGEGRTWVEAEFDIIGVRSANAERYQQLGKCRPPKGNIYICRGAKGTNKGFQACGYFEY